jgi:hypothetical protein
LIQFSELLSSKTSLLVTLANNKKATFQIITGIVAFLTNFRIMDWTGIAKTNKINLHF